MSLILYELEVTIIMFFLFFIDNVLFLIFSFIPRLMMLSLCFQIDNFRRPLLHSMMVDANVVH